MFEFIAGVAVGAVTGVIVKDKVLPNPLITEVEVLKRELKDVSIQNKQYKSQVENQEGIIAKQNTELKSLRLNLHKQVDSSEDEKDKIIKLQKTVSDLRTEKDNWKRQLEELNQLYTARKQELSALQDKYDDLKNKER